MRNTLEEKAAAAFTVKRGSVALSVYYTPNGLHDGWTVVHYEPDGSRQRTFRASKEDAEAKAEEIATRLANVKDTLVGREAQEASQAEQLARQAGTTLLGGMRDYLAIVEQLAGRATPAQAVAFFLAEHEDVVPVKAITLEKLLVEFLDAQKQDSLGDRHIKDLDNRLGKFCNDMKLPLSKISAAIIEDWLRAEQKANSWAGRTRNHYRANISNLLNYAKRRGYLPRDWAEMDFVKKAEETDEEIGIYSAADLGKILAQPIDADLLPYVVLGAFAGLRPSEVGRLDWKDFHFDTGELFVGQGKVRTAGHRVAPFLPAAIARLAHVRKDAGPITRLKYHAKPLAALLAAAGVASVHDGLRHSFITYRRAITKDLPRVSGETGTDPGTLTKRYCRPVQQAEAEAWFSV